MENTHEEPKETPAVTIVVNVDLGHGPPDQRSLEQVARESFRTRQRPEDAGHLLGRHDPPEAFVPSDAILPRGRFPKAASDAASPEIESP